MSDAVTLAYVHSTEVTHSFHDSLVNLLLLDAANEQRILRGGYLPVRYGTDGLVAARNMIAAQFLDGESDWLFIIDTDMGFAPDTLERLLAAAHPEQRPIVGALCFAWRELEPDGFSGYRCAPRPTIFRYVPTEDGHRFMGVSSYPPDEVVECAGTGSACILIHRSVFEAIRKEWGSTWYDRITGDDGKKLGEDISFCVRAGACGFPIHVHTGVQTTHLKQLWVGEPDYFQFLAIRQPTATPLVAVIPMKDHVELTEALVAQLVEQGECAEIVVCDNGSNVAQRRRLDDLDVTVLDCPDMGIHEMWNKAADYAIEHHRDRVRLAFLNNDIRVGPKFMSMLAKAIEETPGLQAVSGNYDGRTADGPVVFVEDICAGRYDGTGGLAGFAFMVRGDWFTSGYRFPEVCKWWYGDNDLVQAILVGEGKVGIAIGAEVEHLDGGSQTGGDWSAFTNQLAADKIEFDILWRQRRAAIVEMQQTAQWDPQALAGVL